MKQSGIEIYSDLHWGRAQRQKRRGKGEQTGKRRREGG